jgi:hypothetical protein
MATAVMAARNGSRVAARPAGNEDPNRSATTIGRVASPNVTRRCGRDAAGDRERRMEPSRVAKKMNAPPIFDIDTSSA